MKTYTVHLLTPYCSWEGVEAKSQKEAMRKCNPIAEPDSSEYQTMVAILENDDENDDDEDNS